MIITDHQVLLTEEELNGLAQRFFPHLMPYFGRLAVWAALGVK
jgi:hypothetical protein